MKILHVEDWFHPEMGYQVNFFAKYHSPEMDTWILSVNDFSLWKINADKIDEMISKDRNFENQYQVKIVRVENAMKSQNKYGTWIKKLRFTINQINPDVVYTHGLETFNSMRIILSRINKKRLIVSDTHTLLNQFKPSLKFKLYMWFFTHIYVPAINRKDISVFYTAEENQNILLDVYKINSKNVHPCLIGTDLTQYYFDSYARNELRNKLNIPEDEPVLLYTGKFSITKQPHLILTAVKIIEELLKKPLHLVFVGSSEKEYMDKYFTFEFNTNIKTYLIPAVNAGELYKYYSFADFAVFPKENTLSALDAQACKLPVIMQSDLTNDFRLQKGGLVYQYNNIDDLGKQILRMVDDKELRKSLSENGYHFICENYNYKTIISGMENTIKEKFQAFLTKQKLKS